jgi:hypothetical protein
MLDCLCHKVTSLWFILRGCDCPDCIAPNGRMTRLGKDIGHGCGLKYVLSRHLPGKTRVKISDALDEIRTEHLPNASLYLPQRQPARFHEARDKKPAHPPPPSTDNMIGI